MALKDIWKDKIDNVDDVLAEDINNIANAVIDNENNKASKTEVSEYVLQVAETKADVDKVYTMKQADERFQEKLSEKQLQNINDVSNKQDKLTQEQIENINKNVYSKEQADEKFQEKLSEEQLANIAAVSDKTDRNVVANALKGTASGEAVGMTDVSPLEHIMGVKVASDIVTDLTTVTVKKYGANILNYTSFDKGIKAEDGSVSFKNAEGASVIYAYTPFVVFPAGSYIASIDTISLSTDGSYNVYVQVDANNDFTRPLSNKTKTRAFTIIAPTRIRLVAEIGVATDVQFKIQMNIGNAVLPFEKYIEPTTYTPNADGTVEGVTSLYPTTTLMTDTAWVVVDAEYNRDINKAYEELVQAIISLGGNV